MSDYTISLADADKHVLYEWAVQDPLHVIDFVLEQYGKRHDGIPRILREDFCGTALVSSHWVKGNSDRRAIALDLDGPTLDWGREHNLAPLGADQHRVELLNTDVRTITSPSADAALALSFSTSYLYPMSDLIEYFRIVRQCLAPGGMFFVDCYGGWEAQQTCIEEYPVVTPDGSFGFIWEQVEYNPITNRAICHIHFALKGGERLDKAFSCNLRFYSIAEIADALAMAGFANIECFWNIAENEYVFRSATHAENRAGWMAYVVADA